MSDVLQLQKVQTPRALFRQPLALQWFQDGELIRRKDEERQAGESSGCLAPFPGHHVDMMGVIRKI